MSNADYSDRAITLRIRQVSQLRKLCLSLGTAKRLPPPDNPERRDDHQTSVTTRTA